MKRFFVFAALAAIALSACQQNLEIGENKLPGEAVVFTAVTEGSATKTALSENGDGYDVVWSSGDQITIVDAAAKEGVYTTTSTTTRADFTKESGDDAETAPFKAWYPASVYNDGTPALPEVQTYVEGNISGSPMYAESSTNSLEFKNLVGIIRVNVSSAQSNLKVHRIILSADQGLSGEISNAASLSTDFAATVSGTAGVTLDCGEEGVAIGSTAKPFHIAVPANTYTSLSITVVTTDGLSQTRTANTGITVSRSQITGVTISFNDLQPPVTDLSAAVTANTYIVSSAGKYKFKATVKGNGGLDPLTETTAATIDPASIAGVKVLWELYGQGRAIKHDGSAYDISYNDGYVYFSTPDTFVPGDACVAVYDSEGTILWSWLIWATPEPGTMTHNEATFMDKNLGAIDVGNCMRGFLFEWGRKDAFSAANGGYDVYPYVPVASSVFTHSNGSASTMAYTIAHPTEWIRPSSGTSWMSAEEYEKKPWLPDVKTIYDPCPAGWRIPTQANISDISGLPDTGLSNGYDPEEYYKGFGNPGTGYYWTASTDEGADGRAYAFCNDGRNLNHWGQDQGYAIRPVRE